jgi:predicted nucleic acid-binding Zn ribbon protein
MTAQDIKKPHQPWFCDCGLQNDKTSVKCGQCGLEFQPGFADRRACFNCGTILRFDTVRCGECGALLPSSRAARLAIYTMLFFAVLVLATVSHGLLAAFGFALLLGALVVGAIALAGAISRVQRPGSTRQALMFIFSLMLLLPLAWCIWLITICSSHHLD